MKALIEHFRIHGAVHAIWMIGVLIAVIAVLLLRLPDGKSVGDYIAFAASIASLVLAVVAIGQSLIANQSFSETIGSLRETAISVETAARNVAATSATLSENSERMIGEVSQLSPAFKGLSAKVEEQFAQLRILSPSTDTDHTETADDPMHLFEIGPVGGKVALYTLARSFKAEKPIVLNQVFDSKQVWQNFLAGYLQALKNLAPYGVQLEFVSSDSGPTFGVQSLGQFDPEVIITRYQNWAEGKELVVQKDVDAYFGNAGDGETKAQADGAS